MTREEVACTKCGGGFAYLYRRDMVLADHTDIRQVVCRRCGHIVAMEESNGRPAGRDLSLVAIEAYERDNKPKRKYGPRGRPVYTKIPCLVLGCPGEVAKETTTSGLCRACGARQRKWRIGRQTTPPPFATDPSGSGRLIQNPERMKKGDKRK